MTSEHGIGGGGVGGIGYIGSTGCIGVGGIGSTTIIGTVVGSTSESQIRGHAIF